jgi:hypothetical protein
MEPQDSEPVPLNEKIDKVFDGFIIGFSFLLLLYCAWVYLTAIDSIEERQERQDFYHQYQELFDFEPF